VPEAPRQLSDFVPVYHPRAFTPDDASLVDVRAGDERTGIDVTVDLMGPSTVAGRVTGTDPATLAKVELTMARASVQGASPPVPGDVQPDGTFLFSSVTPGQYRVVGRVLSPEVPGIELPLKPCARIEGRLVFHGEAGSTSPGLSGVRVDLEPEVAFARRATASTKISAVSDGAAFQLGGLGDIAPGRYSVRVDRTDAWRGPAWMVESVTVDGQDVFDQSLDIAAARDSMNMIVTLTSRRTSLSGRLELPDGRPATDFVVVAFTTNRALWRRPFRRVVAARPATDGQYSMQNLPPGEYYVAALSEVAPDEWLDPALLSETVPLALRLTVGPGEAVVQGLRILRRNTVR
jgi:hypothetical protein